MYHCYVLWKVKLEKTVFQSSFHVHDYIIQSSENLMILDKRLSDYVICSGSSSIKGRQFTFCDLSRQSVYSRLYSKIDKR